MAQLKDLLVSGVSRFVGKLFADEVQLTTLNIPTASNGTTYGPGTSGQVLATNNNSVYWKSLTIADIGGSTVLPVSLGGTGATVATKGGVVYGTGTTYGLTAAGTSGYLLQSGGTGAPTWINATNANTASTIVKRDASGNFSAGTITATLNGNASSATKLGSQTIGGQYNPIYLNAGTATQCSSPSMLTDLGSTTAVGIFQASPRPGITGTLPLAHGGTGATTAANARTNLGTWSLISDSYNTIMPADGTTNGWYKFGTSNTSYGILPSAPGGAGSGHNYIGTSSWYWKYAYIDEIHGTLKGNADTATKATQDGSGNTITSTYVKKAGDSMTGNLTANGSVTLGTPANPWHQLVLGGTTNATMTADSTNPRITFQENTGTQPVHLIYSDQDTYRSPAGLKVIGGSSATPAWFEVEGSYYATGTSTGQSYSILGNGVEYGRWWLNTIGKAGTATTYTNPDNSSQTKTGYTGNVTGNIYLSIGNNKAVGSNGSSYSSPGTAGTANNAQGYLRLYSSGTAYGEMTGYGDYIYPTKGIAFPENKVALNFRPGSSSYYTHFSHQTSGNEALVMATQNAVTSFIFVNGESLSNIASDRWTKLTGASGAGNAPGLQIKNNCVSIGKLIPNGTTPTYKLEVNGTGHFKKIIVKDLDDTTSYTETEISPGIVAAKDDLGRISLTNDGIIFKTASVVLGGGTITLVGSSNDGHSTTMHLPDFNGDGYLVHASSTSQIGSSTQPVYISSNGRIATCTAYASASVNHAATADSATSAGSATTASKANAANISTNTNGVAYYTNTSGAFGNIRSTSGAFYSTGTDVKPVFGTLPIAQGGTGATAAADARTNLGLGSIATYTAAPAGTKDTWGKVPVVGGSDGVLEIGKYIDFHTTDGNTADYDVRITAATTGLTISGTTTGTFSGNLTGNVTGSLTGPASKLGTQTVGATDRPIYLSSGVPNQTTYRMAATNTVATTARAITDNLETGIWYVNGTNSTDLYSIADGAAYVNKYSDSWIAEIYQDYRTGQIALRGKNNGTWQNWRKVLDSSNYTTWTVTKTGGGASGSWGISITGNAATANKLGTATVGSTVRPIYLNSGTATAVSWYPDYCTVDGGNKANYPWHRIATTTTGTGQWVDKDAVLVIRSRYNGGPYGIIKISARTNATNSAIDISARWMVRSGFAIGDVRIAKTSNSTGTNTTIDCYVKCGAYPRRYVYILEGSNNGFSLINSNEVNNTTESNPLTSTEVYKDVSTTVGANTYVGVTSAIQETASARIYSTMTYPTSRSYIEYQQDQSTGSGDVNLRHHNALAVSSNMNTTETGTKWTELWIGNATASGTVGNSQGWLALYGSDTTYTQIAKSGTGNSNYFYIPSYSGTGYAVTSSTTTKGSATTPVYLTTNAQLAECTSPSLQVNLASTSAANVFAQSPRPGVTGVLGIANGGTGQTSAADVFSALSWTAGTTAGPTLSATIVGQNRTATIPSASATASGVVTTDAQTFKGNKTFNNNIYLVSPDGTNYPQISFRSSDGANIYGSLYSSGDQTHLSLGGTTTSGKITIYSSGNHYVHLAYNGSSDGYQAIISGYSGNQYLTHTASTTAVGNSYTPVYVAANGRITACYDMDSRYVNVSGDTMTGALKIKGLKGTSNTDYGTALPSSGSEGQIFFQISDETYEIPTGGTIGQALIKNSNADRDVKWGSIGQQKPGTAKFYPSGSTSTTANTNDAVFNTSVYVQNSVLFGAAWNDYAEYRETTTPVEAGRVVVENGDDTLSLSTERMQPGAEIVSDTFGFAIGQTEKSKTAIAASGRVLAYPHEPRRTYKPGQPVCSGPNGTVSQMTDEEARMYPWCIIGTVSSIPEYDTWGEENIQVNGRIWIRIR